MIIVLKQFIRKERRLIMIPQKELKQAIDRTRREEEIKSRQKLKAFDEIIREILTSSRTLFRTKIELEEILERKISTKRKKLKLADFTLKEISFLKEIILLAGRDEQISNIFCDPFRNSSTILGGFARRIYELCEKKLQNLDALSKAEMKAEMKGILREISRSAKIISGRTKIIEKDLNNLGNKSNKKKKKKKNNV